ncbi:hypothetical protein [Paenibacillus sp. Leaf72]|uniref:hypothetical protein n=1 Tax=Paenibacillus sp. Leaf72 TaxID=1736234 RepID=UPI0006FC8881|nr:hypothetical protein [Paenibacillus sp. Leaf72]KQN96926.1 hypothetical protein ASF12_22925 [Paenibacillus sp. Leaf72]
MKEVSVYLVGGTSWIFQTDDNGFIEFLTKWLLNRASGMGEFTLNNELIILNKVHISLVKIVDVT